MNCINGENMTVRNQYKLFFIRRSIHCLAIGGGMQLAEQKMNEVMAIGLVIPKVGARKRGRKITPVFGEF
jgi:hypothetical protein